MPKQKWENITKAKMDKREYRVIECNNGLVAALVSDPKTDKAAVALTVQVGSAADPDELQGLAHFLEHMLFLGSEKFPSENDYKKFLIEHGGSANASTSIDKTTYYLTVSPDYLEGAMDRFSQFFVKPLMSPDMTEREVKAVNMECERNRKVDRRRLMRLERWLSKVGHPYRKFSTGNKQLLETEPQAIGVNVRNELLNFHKRWYSANIMKVAVISRESLDDLEDKVSVFFSQVLDKDVKPYVFTEHPYGEQETGIIYYTAPIKNRSSLEIMFPCSDFADHYTSGPVEYVKYLLERTSRGTLYSYLRKHFWIDKKIISGLHVITKGMAKFSVKFNLTEEGLAQYERIVYAFFQYINMIRNQCINESIWNECAKISEINFEYKENTPPQKLVLDLVEQLSDVPYEDILVADYKLTKWDPEVIKTLLSYLRVKNARIRLVSKKYENVLKEEDPIYGVRYKIEKIPQSKIEMWDDGSVAADFKIPMDDSSANTMIPTNFDLIKPEYPVRNKPDILNETKYSRLWYMADVYYLLPKAYIRLNFYCPTTYVTPAANIMAYMMLSKIEDAAIESNWDADSAGMATKLDKTPYGWQIYLSGYSEKITEYLVVLLKVMKSLVFDSQELNSRKETLKRMLANQEMDTPIAKSNLILRMITNDNKWTTEELLDSIEIVSLEYMETMYRKCMTQAYCDLFVYGNLSKEATLGIYQQFWEMFPHPVANITANQMREDREIILPTGNLLLIKEEDVHTSSCTLVYFHLGAYSYELAATAELFLQYIREPVFSVLRTKEQLAYSVKQGVDRSAGCLGMFIQLLTEKHPRYTDDRIEKLMQAMGSALDNLEDATIDTHRRSLLDIMRTVPKKMWSKCEEVYAEIKSRRYDFDRKDKEIAVVEMLKKGHLVTFYNNYIATRAPQKRRLSIHILSNAGEQPTYIVDPQSISYREIKDIIEFKNSCQTYPLTYVLNPRTVIQ